MRYLILLMLSASLAWSADPSVVYKLGWQPDAAGVKDRSIINNRRVTASPINPSSDLRGKMPVITSQGDLGSCTGQGVGAVLDVAHKMAGGSSFFDPSKLFLYYQARVMEETVNQDAGAQIRDVVAGALKFGSPRERTWPYIISRFAWKPSAAAYTEGLRYQALNAYKCSTIDDIKRALSSGLPVVFGVPVYRSIFDLKGPDATIQMPKVNERQVGGHCMVFSGHNDAGGYFLVRNSWGKEWGNKGYCKMPYKYAEKFRLGLDAWVIDNAE